MQKKTKSISLRIEPKISHELEFIRKFLNLNLSRSIEESIHAKYLQLKDLKERKTPIEILNESRFVGCLELSEDQSTHYKTVNLEVIRKKHGL